MPHLVDLTGVRSLTSWFTCPGMPMDPYYLTERGVELDYFALYLLLLFCFSCWMHYFYAFLKNIYSLFAKRRNFTLDFPISKWNPVCRRLGYKLYKEFVKEYSAGDLFLAVDWKLKPCIYCLYDTCLQLGSYHIVAWGDPGARKP